MRLFIIVLSVILLAGCGTGKIQEPLAETKPSSMVDAPVDSSSGGEVSVETSLPEVAPATPLERFEQITNRYLEEWTTEDFLELLSMSNCDLGIDLEKHYGGRNYVFGIIGSSVDFPNGCFDLIRSDYPWGYLKYDNDHSYHLNEFLYPSIITLGYSPQNKLLGAELGESLRDVIDVLGEAEIEYVVRVGGGEKFQVYFMRYTIDGLVFLFECDLTGELTELPPHPPLPTIDEILDSEVLNVHIMKDDCYLLEQLDASILYAKTKTD